MSAQSMLEKLGITAEEVRSSLNTPPTAAAITPEPVATKPKVAKPAPKAPVPEPNAKAPEKSSPKKTRKFEPRDEDDDGPPVERTQAPPEQKVNGFEKGDQIILQIKLPSALCRNFNLQDSVVVAPAEYPGMIVRCSDRVLWVQISVAGENIVRTVVDTQQFPDKFSLRRASQP